MKKLCSLALWKVRSISNQRTSMILAQTNGTPGKSTSGLDFISVDALCYIYHTILLREAASQLLLSLPVCVHI